MQHNIFNEFRSLAEGNEEAITRISYLEAGFCDEGDKMKAAEEIWRLVAPKCPSGHRYRRDTYWGMASRNFIHWGLAGKQPERKAKWMAEHRTMPRPPRFERIAYVPQPSDRKF